MPLLHPDRLFPADPDTRAVTRRLYQSVKALPIVSPHGHTDPAWFAANEAFSNPSALLIQPDHYVFRMLFSQGVRLEDVGVRSRDGTPVEADPRKIWRVLAKHWPLFRGTPSRMWLDHVFEEVFGIEQALTEANADALYDHIDSCLKTPEFRPRALFERFNIEVIATTESPLDTLSHHRALATDPWQTAGGKPRVITAYRPDPVVDPAFDGFVSNIKEFGEITGEDTATWKGYLRAHRNRRAYFKQLGATSTDHGHPTARTVDLSVAECEALYAEVLTGNASPIDAEAFRAQMLTEMACMSLDDGLVMQIHPGSRRNHSADMLARFGRDKGFDIPTQTSYVDALKPLLDKHGLNPNLSIILFTLDETSYARELAPLAGVYPSLKLGPAWWFHDAPEGMRRFREQTTETAGFANTVGFNDDTRAFLSIPARHDVARRVDCSFLARLVVEHRLLEDEAVELAHDLAYRLAKSAYRL
ncbi:glucuronate isomerase [Collimonas sp. OK607]|uniref:glucuronate isomerase n=1 Tax=Collimonas sp. OK607 TaxID=1798194 RepID=UPI0008E1DB9B|nr:glucuronate isomerase [Collimonas sp. OK607]SFB06291.1 glucuronate isomerase [Collimonas sp. OK607]